MKTKHIIFIVFCVASVQLKCQTNSFVYTYDNAGNMIQRQLQIIPSLPPGGQRLSLPKDSAEISAPLNFKIYPNPTNQYVNIEGDLPENVSEANIVLLNSTGQILKTDTYNEKLKTINVSDLKSGIYLLEIIYSKNKKSTYKIIVSN